MMSINSRIPPKAATYGAGTSSETAARCKAPERDASPCPGEAGAGAANPQCRHTDADAQKPAEHRPAPGFRRPCAKAGSNGGCRLHDQQQDDRHQNLPPQPEPAQRAQQEGAKTDQGGGQCSEGLGNAAVRLEKKGGAARPVSARSAGEAARRSAGTVPRSCAALPGARRSGRPGHR